MLTKIENAAHKQELITPMACSIVEGMDMDSLIAFGIEMVEKNLAALSDADFLDEYNRFYDDGEVGT